MELELRHLKVVSTIASAGSITKAAAELGVAQPALTAQLGRIERTLGGSLFDRDHRGVRATALGELVISRAGLLLPAMSGLLEEANRFSDSTRERGRSLDRLSLGSSTSALLAPLIQRLASQHPTMTVGTTASWSADEVAVMLDDGRIDAAVVGGCAGSGPPGHPDLVWRTFAVDPVFVLLPDHHALAGRADVTLAELSEADWAATPGDGCFRDCFAAACAAEGFTPSSLFVTDADTSMMSAMERDLGLDQTQASTRLAAEKQAASAETSLRGELGARFAGAWFDADSGRLQVAVTSSAAVSTVRAEGADAQQVTRSAADLDAVMKTLDAQRADAPSTVPGWFVDVESNRVVVQHRGSVASAKSFVKEAGAPVAAISYEASREMPQPLEVVGGNAYFINNSFRCSVGFAVNGGFITAGHCGEQGATTTTPSGSFAGSSFPGNDYAYVRTSEASRAAVNNYSGGTVAVRGASSAPIGSSICRSGSTTGWQCGTIQARNSTVNYAEGSVSGLIRTNACAEGGDSGGSALSGNQAQGVTSGGSGDCTVGGTTYFQPVGEILNAYGLTLKTS